MCDGNSYPDTLNQELTDKSSILGDISLKNPVTILQNIVFIPSYSPFITT
jgi:hypothetical protein